MYLNWKKAKGSNTQSIFQYNLKIKKREEKLLLSFRCKWQQNNTFQCEAMINTYTHKKF